MYYFDESLICMSILFRREISAEAILELDIFNLSADKGKKAPNSTSGGAFTGPHSTRRAGMDPDTDAEDNSALFWQPGKRGYYAPRQGKGTPERMNVFRNIGRYISYIIGKTIL